MPAQTVRISNQAYIELRDLAKISSKPMTELLEEAIEDLKRKKFFQEFQQSYASLMNESDAASSYKNEVKIFDHPLMDGMEPEEWD